MAKKTFMTGLDLLLGSENYQDKEPVRNKRIPLKKKEIRVTLIVEEESMEKIKAIAFWHRITIKEIINTAIAKEIERYELKGKIKPIPTSDDV